MKKQEISKRLLCLCLFWLMVLSLAACKGQTDEQDSQPPTATIVPTEVPTPTPTPAPTPPIPYTDVPSDADYYDAVVWAYKNGIVSDGSTFDPVSTCTRGQTVTSLWRAMGSPEPQTAENPINDISPDDWYYKSALWAYENGVTSNITFNSGNPCTNAEVLTFLWRANGRPMVAADSDEYYAKAVKWAENSGMFAGMDSSFDPAAPCSRAELITYLYWAEEQWTLSEEDKTIQEEYEQIMYSAEPCEGYGPGLCFADYVDVDGDGKVELLTVSLSENLTGNNPWRDGYAYDVTATVYANIDGHAQKNCEQTFSWGWNDESLYICKNNNRLCLRNTWLHMGTSSVGEVFYKIENGAFVLNESVEISYASEEPEYYGMTEAEYNALDQKYTGSKELLSYNFSYGASVHNRGIAPSRSEYQKYWENYWTEYWVTSDPMYAAALNGDFSAFAGTYTDESGWGGNMSINKDGVLTATGGYYDVTQQKPISVTVTESGAIRCVIQQFEWTDWDGRTMYSVEYFILYPAGVSDNGDPNNPDYQSDPTKVRLEYWWPSQGVSVVLYSKIS